MTKACIGLDLAACLLLGLQQIQRPAARLGTQGFAQLRIAQQAPSPAGHGSSVARGHQNARYIGLHDFGLPIQIVCHDRQRSKGHLGQGSPGQWR